MTIEVFKLLGTLLTFIGGVITLISAIIVLKRERMKNMGAKKTTALPKKKKSYKIFKLPNKWIIILIIGIVVILLSLILFIYFIFLKDMPHYENMILIKGSNFIRNGETIHIRDYYISKSEITTKEYLRFVEENNEDSRLQPQWRYPEKKNDPIISEYYFGFTGNDQPIVGISWLQANSFCEWLSKKLGKKFHLPTEVQWEFAARANGIGDFGLGINGEEIDSNNLYQYAWYQENKESGRYSNRTRPVMLKKTNKLGIYDIWGNAAEWTEDDHKNGGKVYKGGCWDDPLQYCETNFSDGIDPSDCKRFISFRVVYEK